MSFWSWIKKQWEKVERAFSNIHHGIWGGYSMTERNRIKYANRYKEKLKRINEEYNLKLSEKLIDDVSYNYGVYQDKEEYGDDISIGMTYNSSLSGGQNLANNILMNFNSVANMVLNNIAINDISKIQKYNRETPIDEKSKRIMLTEILMKDPFSIFANGSLYKKGRPGTKSYDPLTPWEPYKYITGDIKPDEFNDILMGRSHLKLAGNRDYYSNVWAEPEWGMPDKNRINQFMTSYINSRQKQIYKGFQEINSSLGWVPNPGLGGSNPAKRVLGLETYYENALKSEKYPKRIKISRYSEI